MLDVYCCYNSVIFTLNKYLKKTVFQNLNKYKNKYLNLTEKHPSKTHLHFFPEKVQSLLLKSKLFLIVRPFLLLHFNRF